MKISCFQRYGPLNSRPIIGAFINSLHDAGDSVLVDKDDITKSDSIKSISTLRRKIGMIFQDFKLLNDRTVYDNVALPFRNEGKSKVEMIELVNEALNKVNLSFGYNLNGKIIGISPLKYDIYPLLFLIKCCLPSSCILPSLSNISLFNSVSLLSFFTVIRCICL